MSDERHPEPTKTPRPTRSRMLALPRWFATRDAPAAPRPGADRPIGESFPVFVALVFCAAGVCLTVLAIGRITAPARVRRAALDASPDPVCEVRA